MAAPKREEPAGPLPDVIATFRADVAGPEDVERLIDARLEKLEDEIKATTAHLEELRGEKKRWLSVTGGKPKDRNNGPTDAA